MFVPLRDRNRLKTIAFQRVTVGLIVLNCAAYLVELSLGTAGTEHIWATLGFTPATFFAPDASILSVLHPPAYTLFTHTFLHEDFWHLASNMLFLWVFGDNVEDAMGSWRFLGFYLLAGALAAGTEGVLGPNPDLPMIGASGAVAACIGAYIVLYPRAKIWILLLFRVPLLLPAYVVVGLFIATQIIYAAFNLDAATAWFAHIGGFAAGGLLVILMRRPGVHLFNPADPKPAPALAAAKDRRDRSLD